MEPNIFLGVPRVWEILYEKVEPDVRSGKYVSHICSRLRLIMIRCFQLPSSFRNKAVVPIKRNLLTLRQSNCCVIEYNISVKITH